MLFSKKRPVGHLTGPLELRGTVAFTGSGTFSARLEGDITASDSLTLETNAQVNGSVRARNLDIAGALSGHALASESLLLRPSAQLTGSLSAASATIEPGAAFQGDLSIGPHP